MARPTEDTATTDPAAAFQAAQRRPWRWTFLVYAVVLTVATHWPKLVLAPEVPASDKTLHLLAFAMLTFLLWRTGWLRRRTSLLGIGLLWGLLDEWTQKLPGLNRHFTFQDITADALGVLVVVVWLWALRPIGGDANRRRLQLQQHAFDEVFRRPRVWIMLGAVLLVGAVPVALLWGKIEARHTARLIILTAVAAAIVTKYIVFLGWRRELHVIDERRPCYACNASCNQLTLDGGRGTCPTCGSPIAAGQWSPPPLPSSRALVSMIGWPFAAALVVITLVVGTLLVASTVNAVAPGHAPLARALHVIGRIPPGLTGPLDLSLCLILFALATAWYRQRLARYVDQALVCRACGHDLRETPTAGPADTRGGRCGECGAAFVRHEAPT